MQLIERGFKILTCICAFNRAIDEHTQFTQTFRITEDLALIMEFIIFADVEFGLLNLLDFVAQELGSPLLFANVLLERVEFFIGFTPFTYLFA